MLRIGLGQRLRRQIDRGPGQRLEEPLHHLLVDRLSPQPLTDRLARLLPQMVAQILRASLVLHAQLVAALAAVRDSVQESLAVARHAARLIAVILGMVVAEHLLNLLKRQPGDVGRILVAHDDPPVGDGERTLPVFPCVFHSFRARAAIHEGARIGRVLDQRTDAGHGRIFPADVAAAVAPRDDQVVSAEVAHDLGQRFLLQQGLEDQSNPFTNLLIGMLFHPAILEPHQSCRQRERQLAALGLAEDAGGQSSAERMEFELRNGAFQTQEQAAINGAGIIDAVPIGNQTTGMAAQVQELIPVRAVAGQTRGVIRHDHADLPQPHLGCELLKAQPAGRRRGTVARVVINDQDVFFTPPEFADSPLQGILQPLALGVGEHLMGARLADIDYGAAGQMSRLNQIGSGHAASPEECGLVPGRLLAGRGKRVSPRPGRQRFRGRTWTQLVLLHEREQLLHGRF